MCQVAKDDRKGRNIMVQYNGYTFNISKLMFKNAKGEWEDIDHLPYGERETIEVIYTAGYIYDTYMEDYGIETEEECLEIAEQAREAMSAFDIDEDSAVEEAMEDMGYEYQGVTYEEEEN